MSAVSIGQQLLTTGIRTAQHRGKLLLTFLHQRVRVAVGQFDALYVRQHNAVIEDALLRTIDIVILVAGTDQLYQQPRRGGDTKIPLLIGVSTSWLIQIPGTVLMVYFINSSLFAIWGLLTFYLGVDAFLMVLRRRSGVWKTIKVIDLPPAPVEEEVTES